MVLWSEIVMVEQMVQKMDSQTVELSVLERARSTVYSLVFGMVVEKA